MLRAMILIVKEVNAECGSVNGNLLYDLECPFFWEITLVSGPGRIVTARSQQALA